MRRVALATLLCLAAACEPSRESAPVSQKPAPAIRAASNDDDACPPIDEAKIAPPVCDAGPIATPIPPIADERHALASFYEAYAALARGAAHEHLRIAMFGDSNLTMDELTGRMRRHWQQRFGDAGHGFVALSIPWTWYHHSDVHHDGQWDRFKLIASSTDPVPDGHYGMGNIAAESRAPGATVWVRTADDDAPIGRKASRFDVFFLKRPGGGVFDVVADGRVVRTVETASPTVTAGVEHIDLEDAPHKIECTVRSTSPVRFYGITLERDEKQPSIVVDSLGAGALNFEQLVFASSTTRKAMLARRSPKLVAFQIGTNTFMVTKHHERAKQILDEVKATLPGASILLLSPPDTMLDWKDAHSDPRIVQVARQLAEIARENDVAFWDYREAMGGDRAIKTFVEHELAAGDRIHLRREGSELMADRFLCALGADFRAWLSAHPRAGCPSKVTAPGGR